MTGAENYTAAESLLQMAEDTLDLIAEDRGKSDPKEIALTLGLNTNIVMVAQVHATLALAAAVERQTSLAHGVDTAGYGR